MPSFGSKSIERLNQCHPDIRKVMLEVVKTFDCQILEGYRGKDAQDKAVAEGKSKTPWPTGKHNTTPSQAVDVVPYYQGKPLDWNYLPQFHYFAGYVLGVASQMGVSLRWGGDWNGNNDLRDQTFNDLPHFELRS